MSTYKRILSGSALAWFNMGVAMFGQIALVPILLSRWSAGTYGVWLTLQALVGYLSLLSLSYQTFLQGEFLKAGRQQPNLAKKLFWSALLIAWVLALLELLLLVLFYLILDFDLFVPKVSEPLVPTSKDIFWILFAYGLMNLILMPFGGIVVKLLTVYGYFARMTAWGILRQIMALLVPVALVIQGQSFLIIGLGWVAAHFVAAFISSFDFIYLLRKEQLLGYVAPNWRLGGVMLLKAQALSFRDFLDSMRQKGIRLLMAGSLGGVAVAAFSTNRTVANVLRQGVGTLTNPLLPELMNAVVRRDQDGVESMFAVVWGAVLFLMIPAFLVMQLTVAPAFEWWTQGKIAFDPLLFALFASGILVYAASQPALSILRGYNLLHQQLVLSILAGVVVLISVVLLMPFFSVQGVAMGLILGELVAAVYAVWQCAKWMQTVGLDWPRYSFSLVGIGTSVASMALIAMAILPLTMAVVVAVVSCLASCCFGYFYMRSLPLRVQEQLRQKFYHYAAKIR